MYPGKLDDKGRMKLPSVFAEYLAALSYVGQKKLFVTSLDGRIARIYPQEVWRQNELFFVYPTAVIETQPAQVLLAR